MEFKACLKILLPANQIVDKDLVSEQGRYILKVGRERSERPYIVTDILILILLLYSSLN